MDPRLSPVILGNMVEPLLAAIAGSSTGFVSSYPLGLAIEAVLMDQSDRRSAMDTFPSNLTEFVLQTPLREVLPDRSIAAIPVLTTWVGVPSIIGATIAWGRAARSPLDIAALPIGTVIGATGSYLAFSGIYVGVRQFLQGVAVSRETRSLVDSLLAEPSGGWTREVVDSRRAEILSRGNELSADIRALRGIDRFQKEAEFIFLTDAESRLDSKRPVEPVATEIRELITRLQTEPDGGWTLAVVNGRIDELDALLETETRVNADAIAFGLVPLTELKERLEADEKV